MKNLIIVLCIISLFLMTGCYTVRIFSDTEKQITIASRSENLPFKETYRVWYALWGLVPINDNSINHILSTSKVKKVRITTKMGLIDWILSSILGYISIVTWTVEIEGAE
ncbi:MAG: hypothetical protein N2643_04560 [Endomicrobia bacterium]|nr:hypothetical protein [Endomicrobiia bacterium]